METSEVDRLKPVLDRVRAKYIRDYAVSEETARNHEREALRYLELSASKAGSAYTMMGVADDYWHTFLLFSREYAEYCDGLAGRFIHHVPADLTKTGEARKLELKNYVLLFQDYLKKYGEMPPRAIWPYPTRKMIDETEIILSEKLLSEFEKHGVVLDGPNCNCGCGSPCGNHCGCSKCSCGD